MCKRCDVRTELESRLPAGQWDEDASSVHWSSGGRLVSFRFNEHGAVEFVVWPVDVEQVQPTYICYSVDEVVWLLDAFGRDLEFWRTAIPAFDGQLTAKGKRLLEQARGELGG